jgi:hypothetical protein
MHGFLDRRHCNACEQHEKRGTCLRRDGNRVTEHRDCGGQPPRRTEGTVSANTNERAASERVERLERALKERARRLEILDRQAVARRETEDRRLREEE